MRGLPFCVIDKYSSWISSVDGELEKGARQGARVRFGVNLPLKTLALSMNVLYPYLVGCRNGHGKIGWRNSVREI